MDHEEAERQLAAADWFPVDVDGLSIIDQLDILKGLADAGQLPADGAAIMYALAGRLRYLADCYERDLIRSLRWGPDDTVTRTWAQVADAVQAQLGSRQAAHQRWGRLKSPARRTTSGDARRGAAAPRSQ